MSFPDPPPAPAATTCFFHKDRETGRRCTRCGNYACPECLTTASVGSHCWQCIKAAPPPKSEQLKRTLAEPLLVTKTIIGLNVLVFILQAANGSDVGSSLFGGSGRVSAFEQQFGYVTGAAASNEIWRMATTGFIHFGLMHIGFNMLILYRLGDQLERGVGGARFLALYVVSLLGGSFGTALISNRNEVGGGASGAVFGLAAAAAIALMQRGVPFYSTGWAPLLAINLVFTFAIPNVGIGAHVGGLIFGGLIGFVMLHPQLGRTAPWLGYVAAIAVCIACLAGARAIEQNRYGDCRGITYESRHFVFCDGFLNDATADAEVHRGSSSNVPVSSSSIRR